MEKTGQKNKSAILIPIVVVIVIITIILFTALFIFHRNYTLLYGEVVSRDEANIRLRASGQADLAVLSEFNALETIDLRDTAADAGDVAALQRTYPDCRILWIVKVCEGLELENEAVSVTLADSIQTEGLIDAAASLSLIREIKVDYPNISRSQYDALAAAFPTAEIEYSVEIGGEDIPLDTRKLDFSAFSYKEVLEEAALLEMLPELSEIELMDAKGTSPLSLDEVIALQETLPGIRFNYSFELFGQTVSTATEQLEYYETEIGDAGLDTFRQVLPIMYGLKYLRFDNCGTSDEAVAQLRDEFPEVKIVWLLTVGSVSFYTDTLRLRINYNFHPDDMWKLKYCNEVKYIDAGHIMTVFDVEWARYMPDLEVCIIAITSVTDISPLAECKNLEFLEIFTTRITDISPLAECKNLAYLNMGDSQIKDITPLFGLENLKKINCNMTRSVPQEQVDEFRQLHPDTIFNYYFGEYNIGTGWRFSKGRDYNERYALLREQLGYDDPKAALNGGYLQAPIE